MASHQPLYKPRGEHHEGKLLFFLLTFCTLPIYHAAFSVYTREWGYYIAFHLCWSLISRDISLHFFLWGSTESPPILLPTFISMVWEPSMSSSSYKLSKSILCLTQGSLSFDSTIDLYIVLPSNWAVGSIPTLCCWHSCLTLVFPSTTPLM